MKKGNSVNWFGVVFFVSVIGVYCVAGVITGWLFSAITTSTQNAYYEQWGKVVALMYVKECEECGSGVEGNVSFVTMDDDGRIGDEYCTGCQEFKEVYKGGVAK